MAVVNLEGFGQVEIRDDFLDLSPEDQEAEILRAKQAGPVEAPAPVATSVQDDDEDVSIFRDVAEGALAGLVGVAQGLSETAAIGFDYATDSDTSRVVTDTFEATKETLGFTPETTAGEVAELITNFGVGAFVPLSWLSKANAASKSTKALKSTSMFGKSAEAFGSSAAGKALLSTLPGRAVATSLAIGASDFFVAPTGLNTIADAFDALPDELETEEDTNLTGRDEAARRGRNKLRIAAEGAGLGGAFEIAVPVIGKTIGATAQLPGVAPIARGINASFERIGQLATGVSWINRNFTSTKGLQRAVFETLSDARGMTDESANTVIRLVENFDSAAKKAVSAQVPFMKNKRTIEQAYVDLERFLTGDRDALAAYGEKAVEAGDLLRTQIDDLSDMAFLEVEQLTKRGEISAEEAKRILQTIEQNRGTYLRRLYEGPLDIRNPAEFRSTPEYGAAVDEVTAFLQKTQPNKAADEVAQEAIQFVDGSLGFKAGLTGIDEQMVLKQAAKNLKDINNKAATDIPLYDLSEGILKTRNRVLEEAPTLRGLLREKTGTQQAIKERVVRTVTDLSQFSSMSKMYRSIMDDDTLSKPFEGIQSVLNAGARPSVIRRPLSDVNDPSAGFREFDQVEIDTLNKLGYVEMPLSPGSVSEGPYGALSGSMVRKELKDVLTYNRLADSVYNQLWSLSLQAKGISQLGQTVLNPVGQVRNAFGNILMLAGNGNIARLTDIEDSLSLALGKAANLTDAEFKRFYQIMGDLGLRDQNLVMNEARSLMRDGKELVPADEVVRKATQKGAERFVPFYSFLQRTYSGMDNAGKTAALFAEQAKYANAFRRAGVDLENLDPLAQSFIDKGLAVRGKALNEDIPFLTVMSADTVKATMPIYSRVPDALNVIRRTPVFGNFVAFPVEVMRNTTNILNRSMKEMGVKADDFYEGIRAANPQMTEQQARRAAAKLAEEIKAIGAKRLAGLSSVVYTVPAAVQTAMLRLNNMDETDLEAMEEGAAPYQKGHILAPVARVGDKIEFVDLSYMMPYDYIAAPIRAAERVYAEKGEIGASDAEQILSAAVTAGYDLIEPFSSESLIAERLVDVTARKGRTGLGAYIFRDGDDEGEKLAKSVTHVLGGFEPAMMKYIFDVKGGEVVPGRLVRAVTDEPGGQGQEYAVSEELLTLFTGFRKMEMDLNNTVTFAAFEYGGKASSIKSGFTSKARRADTSVDELRAEFLDLQDDLARHQAKLYRAVRAARQLGMSDSDIRKNLKEGKVGNKDIRAIMRGEFQPYSPTSQLAKEIRQKTREQENRLLTRLPLFELRRDARELRGKDLLPGGALRIAPPQLPSTSTPSTVAPATAPQSPVSSTLLGDNPIEQARNLELFQRIRGQK